MTKKQDDNTDNLIIKNICFMIATIKFKNSSHLDNEGYLIGFRSLTDKNLGVIDPNSEFIWIYKKGTIHMYTTKYYSISSITYGHKVDGLDKPQLFVSKAFTESEESQAEAINLTKNLIKVASDEKLVRYNGIVDHEKFKDIPHQAKKDIELTGASKTTYRSPYCTNKDNHTAYDQRYSKFGRGNAGNNWRTDNKTPFSHNYASKPSIETTIFKRTTKYNVGEALNEMSKKIRKIQDGTYKPGKLAKIPADDPKKVIVSDAKDDDDDAYINNFIGI